MVTQDTFSIFLPKWGPRFWNTFAADQLVFQNRGFTVQVIFKYVREFGIDRLF